VVCNKHEIAGFAVWVQSAAGICKDQFFYTEFRHNPDGIGHILHTVALVVMQSSLHTKERNTIEVAEDETTLMTGGC
jgi:hypothetical protein